MYRYGKNRQSSIDPEVPQSLDGVLNSLETLLERRDHAVPGAVQESMESFADSLGEQYDDPLVAETIAVPTLEDKPVDIPVLNDIVSRADSSPADRPADDPQQGQAELDMLLDTLRGELDRLVDDILDDARDRFTNILDNTVPPDFSGLEGPLADFMRDAIKRRHQPD